MNVIDARGLGCPKPVMMAEEAISKIDEGYIEILVDNEASVKNLSKFASKNGLYFESEKIENFWKLKLVKGYVCESPGQANEPVMEKEKDLFLIIGTDTIGKDEALGRILIKGFLETMRVTKEIPHTIFFLNTGVWLTTTNEETVPILMELEKMGVEIFSCGTCLKQFNLEDSLKVGYRGTTNHIVEGLKDFKKTVWI